MVTQQNSEIPFGMLTKSHFKMDERGFEPLPSVWGYDAKSQTSDLLTTMGKATWSRVSSTSTGLLMLDSDPDEEEDD